MPPKNNITLGPGALYFNTPHGAQYIGKIEALEYTEEEPEFVDILGEPPKFVIPVRGEATLKVQVSPRTAEFLTNNVRMIVIRERWRSMCSYYPNQRVVHLANKHGDPLVRKKNAARILRHYGKVDPNLIHIIEGKQRKKGTKKNEH